MAATKFDYETIAPGYYDAVYQQRKGVQSKWHHLKFNGVERKILSGIHYESLLDLACGPGTFLATLPPGKKLYGLDLSEKQIAYARDHYPRPNCEFIVGDAAQIPLPDHSLDVVLGLEFIEHVPEEAAAKILQEVNRCLKPGGHLILTTPNYHSLWPLLEWAVSQFSPVNYQEQHILKFHPAKLREFLCRSGWADVDVRSYLFLSPFLAAISWEGASRFFDFEFRRIKSCGHLLLATARKR